jgi:4'-phosphopantetheinyl transferase EntD
VNDALAGLFPESVRVLCAPIAEAAMPLPMAESRWAESMAAARRSEFAAGRALARQALAALGARPGVLLPDGDRVPVWPDGFCGSISHVRGGGHALCAVAVAPRSDHCSLGLDIELDEPLRPRVIERVVTPAEVRAAATAGMSLADVAVLFFSAKEAVYKAQFPVTRTFLDFADVEVRLDPDSLGFEATLMTDFAETPFPRSVTGQLFRGGGLVAAGLALPPTETRRGSG